MQTCRVKVVDRKKLIPFFSKCSYLRSICTKINYILAAYITLNNSSYHIPFTCYIDCGSDVLKMCLLRRTHVDELVEMLAEVRILK